MLREIIHIDRDLCNGCGNCIPNCHEGAIQMIDDKATLVSELMCDGLGACIGHCPQDAISIEKREAEAYDEVLTLKQMLVEGGKNVVIAHLKHLKDYQLKEHIHEAMDYMRAHKDSIDFDVEEVIRTVQQHGAPAPKQVAGFHNLKVQTGGGCPGSAAKEISVQAAGPDNAIDGKSQLSQWPVQMHLINPHAPFFKDCDLLLAADCAAFAVGDFHAKYLKNKKLGIACPKLDTGKEEYIEKLTALIDEAKIKSLTVLRMEVPCCGGLVQMAQVAMENATRQVPLKMIIVNAEGEELRFS